MAQERNVTTQRVLNGKKETEHVMKCCGKDVSEAHFRE